MCASVQRFRNFGKSKTAKSKLKYMYFFFFYYFDFYLFSYFFAHLLNHKRIKNIRKTSLWLKNSIRFILWVCNWVYESQELKTFLLGKWTYIALCKILTNKCIFVAFFSVKSRFFSPHFNFLFFSRNLVFQHFNFEVELKKVYLLAFYFRGF